MKNGFATENDWYVKNFISDNIFVIRTSFCCLHRGFVQKDIIQDRKKACFQCCYLLCNTSIVSIDNNNSNIFFHFLGCCFLLTSYNGPHDFTVTSLGARKIIKELVFQWAVYLFIETLELDAFKVIFQIPFCLFVLPV